MSMLADGSDIPKLTPERIKFLIGYAESQPATCDDFMAMKELAAAVQQLQQEKLKLSTALLRGRSWGVQSTGFEVRASLELAKWIDSGMDGRLPPLPSPLDEYYEPPSRNASV